MSEHICQDSECRNVHYAFYYLHTCSDFSCKNCRTTCKKHINKCIRYGCEDTLLGNGTSYCKKHVCKYLGCDQSKYGCTKHSICGEYDDARMCTEIVYSGQAVCRRHVCKYICDDLTTCNNIAKGCKHRCQMLLCNNTIINDKASYCVRHICGHKINNGICMNCVNNCEIHGCISGCDLDRHPGYKRCINHLTYDNIIDTLSSVEYYFGVFPRDIMNILKCHF